MVTDARPDSMQLKEMKEMMHGVRTIAQQQAFTEAFGPGMNQTSTDASRTNIAQTTPVIQRVKKKKVAVGVAATLFSLGLIWAVPRFRKYMMDAINDQSVQSQIVNIDPGTVEEIVDDDVIKWYTQKSADVREKDSKLITEKIMGFVKFNTLDLNLAFELADEDRVRDVIDSLLFIDVVKNRYGEKNVAKYEGVILNTLKTLENQYISRSKVIETLKLYEKHFNVKSPLDEEHDFSVADIARSREGGYQWDKSHDDFYKWLNDENANDLPVGARINCWEATLVALIDAQKLTKEEVARTYFQKQNQVNNANNIVAYDPNKLKAVFYDRKVGSIGNANDNNERPLIQRNDILIYNKNDILEGALYHVMIALEDETLFRKYTNVQVMSLWKQNARSFMKSTLGELITLDGVTTIDICRFL
ncbi:hypothetical protein KK083_20540 [Fulvivirgaceae bacterium PWU4]|uniref:Uncharacterized protein n=1 Tax=Chryseosolibacter histidini TaxID=2782349 RepID=A0AAP2DQT1_9BACT|nr:hypothetical protein [Chryseosolibacter histidini]MBT1699297.1 hypothetical protein [Chryseosolibacter histidini]